MDRMVSCFLFNGEESCVTWEERRERGLFRLSGADGADLGSLLGNNVSAGLDDEASSSLELNTDRVGDIDTSGDVNLDQDQVDGELLDLDVNGGLDLGLDLGSNLGRDLGRGLGGQLDGLLDNLLGLELNAGGILLGALLDDDGGNVNLQVSGELGLDLGIDLGLDSSLDGSGESSRELGTKTEVNVDEAGNLDTEVGLEGRVQIGIGADIGKGFDNNLGVLLDEEVNGGIEGSANGLGGGTLLQSRGLGLDGGDGGAEEHGEHGQEEGEESGGLHDGDIRDVRVRKVVLREGDEVGSR
ncbi:MAG: hypothetical protein BYD32DRAFT_429070 [Podila humilis]|nr:MAG: hypothetical protein BYD32DRAFT_429070 [Podila humilis]